MDLDIASSLTLLFSRLNKTLLPDWIWKKPKFFLYMSASFLLITSLYLEGREVSSIIWISEFVSLDDKSRNLNSMQDNILRSYNLYLKLAIT